MKNLNAKYRNNTLSSDELPELREKVNAVSDRELEGQLYDGWMNGEIDTNRVEAGRINRMKKKIDHAIGTKYPTFSRLIRWGQFAAAALLPVFILLTAYFYRENSLMITDEMIVSTEKGERAGITLPDGTSVYLNWDSRLRYTPKEYNKKERKINFDGEGYFQVYRNKDVPFLIHAKGLHIKVMGTAFNLSVREYNKTAELVLEEGNVLLTAIKSNKKVMLLPNEKAILDQLTGDITVISENNVKNASAWRRGDLIFRNTCLSDILQAIEDNYNVSIRAQCEDLFNDRFTGILPLSNLNEVLTVIEKSYHLKAEITGKEIVLKKIND
jgi:ferric-dicitrate binding protein FerR (iron transport regulator)